MTETCHITLSAPVDRDFVEELIKRSVEAEQIMLDSGRIRLQRAVQAAVELYLEQQSCQCEDYWTDGTAFCQRCHRERKTPPGGVEEVSA